MISGSPTLPPQHINAGLGQEASFEMGEGTAYGSNPDNEIFPATTEKIDAGDAYSDRPFLRTDMRAADAVVDGVKNISSKKKSKTKLFNVAGQEVTRNYKGLVITEDGKFIAK